MNFIKRYIEKYKDLSVALKAAMVYTVSSFVTRAFHLITTPLFTRIMTVEQIGIVSNFSTWQSFISDVVTLGLTSSALNIALKDYKDDRVGFIKNSQFLILLSVAIAGLITGILYPFIQSILGMPISYIALIYICIYFNASRSFWMTLNRYEFRYRAVGIVTIAVSVLSAAISVIAVIYANSNGVTDLATVRLFTSSAVTLAFSIPFCIRFFANKKPLVNKEYCKFTFSIATPMIVHTFSKSILSASDRVMINAISGAEALGYYSVLYTLSSLALIVWDSINASLVPYIFGKMEKGVEGERDVNRVAVPLLISFAVISILFILFAPEIVYVIASKKYMNSIYVMPPISIGIFFVSLYSLYANILMYHKKTKIVMTCTMCAAIFNLITNFIFIRLFGYIAAAYTTLASYLFLSAIYCYFSKKIHGRSIFNDKLLWTFSLILTVCGMLCTLLYQNTVLRYIVIGMIFICVLIFRKRIMEVYREIKSKKR